MYNRVETKSIRAGEAPVRAGRFCFAAWRRARALRVEIDQAAPQVRSMKKRLARLIELVRGLPKTLYRTGGYGVIDLVGP